ncbi:MAG: response regulator [Anaerolineales bacterium]
MSIQILVVDDSATTRKLVAITLQAEGYDILTAESGSQALKILGETTPDMLILDVVMPDMDGYELCKRVRHNENTAHLPVMMLTSLTELDEKLKAFEVGADDFLPKPFEPAELRAHVKVLLRRTLSQPATGTTDAHGKVIAIHSLRGGVGVSTLAVNMAAALHELWRQPVVLVDLALLNGQAAVMCNLSIRNSWADLATLPVNQIDSALVEQVLLTHESGLQILSAPPVPEASELLSDEVVRHVLTLLSQKFAYIVIDLPHDFQGTTLAALDNAHAILPVLVPELVSVRAAAASLNVFDKLDYPQNIIHLTLNWTFERRGIPRKDIEQALRRPVRLMLPYIKDDLISALTLGKPPVLYNVDSPISALFEDIAYFLSKPEHKENLPEQKSAALCRVLERQETRQRKRAVSTFG